MLWVVLWVFMMRFWCRLWLRVRVVNVFRRIRLWGFMLLVFWLFMLYFFWFSWVGVWLVNIVIVFFICWVECGENVMWNLFLGICLDLE